MQNNSNFIEELEVERQKIKVLHRELPISLELVSNAIDLCRQRTHDGAETTSSKDKKSGKKKQRKQKRCWSPELHKKFINSLNQLGGYHVATPKLIKESMKVDGLTIGEVKSHLQRYRLSMRSTRSTRRNPQGLRLARRYALVDGEWVQQPERSSPGPTAATVPSSAHKGESSKAKRRCQKS